MKADIETKSSFQLKRYSKTGELYSPIQKDAILQAMDISLPNWRNGLKTFVFPAVSEAKYAGPTLNASEVEKGFAKGDNSETIVLWALKKMSDSNGLGLRIFQGLNIEQKCVMLWVKLLGKMKMK